MASRALATRSRERHQAAVSPSVASLSFSDVKWRDGGVDQLVEVAVERRVELVHREADAVVGDAVFLEVVGADLLGALAGADLRAAILGDRVLLLLHLHLVEARAQHLHRLRAVLDLRLLVLLRHDDVGREVGDAHGRIGRVDALAAGAARAEGVDAEVLGVDLDVDFLGLRQHRHGRGGRVDAAARFGRRHALHAVHAALVLQPAVDVLAGDDRDDFLEAAGAAVVDRQHLDLPAVALGEAGVHPEEIRGEERRLVAAGAGADFQDDVLGVVGILRDEQDLDARRRGCRGAPRAPSSPPARARACRDP